METTLVKTDKLGRISCEHCGAMLDVSDYRIFEMGECPDCEGLFTVPGKLGKYFLLKELGRGGMGAVFLAKDQDLERKVALKVMKSSFGSDPEFFDSLMQEAKSAAALNHKNIVQIFSFGQEKQQPYIVMELVPGDQLDHWLNNGALPSELDVLVVLHQIAEGLAAADEIGLIHGDIKPANILISERGVAKLSDFGVARFNSGAKDARIFGTPLYIAPEKARGKEVDGRSDQFSLGAAFWHVLTGRAPYPGQTTNEVVLERFKTRPPLANKLRPEVSLETSNLLRKAMALKPQDRYANFQELADAVSDIVDSLPEEPEAEPAAQSEAAPRGSVLGRLFRK